MYFGKSKRFKITVLSLFLLLILIMPLSHSMKISKYESQESNITMSARKVIGLQSGFNESVGINDNGSALINNNLIEYSYSTNSLLGYFAFYGGSFYSGAPINNSAFSVQLNSNFNVTSSMTLWAQDVFQVYYINGVYNVNIIDNLWNSTYPSYSLNQSLVSGNGSFSTSNNQVFYYSWALSNNNIITYSTNSPFYLYAYMTINQSSNGYPQIYMYYEFQNSTFNSGWILYDKITVYVKSSNPQFLTGIQSSINSYAPYYPFVTQWVVGGASGGSQLTVYNWNASMGLYYEYNGNFYSVPDAISLQPSIFTASVTAENVNQYYGIQEYYKNGIVHQIEGQNQQEFLWQPKSYYQLNGNNLTLYLTPPNGEWLITISGNNYYNQTFGQYSPISYILQPGNYNLSVTLYAGSMPIETFTSSLTVGGGIVNVTSPVDFYVDGFSHLSGNYLFNTPVNLTFPSIYYINNNSRMLFKYLIVNGQIVKSNTIILYVNANVTAVYQQQFYVTFPFELNGYINNLYQKINNGWYNEGTIIDIPAQTVYNGSYTRFVIYKETYYKINSSMIITPPFYTQYYLKINYAIPAEINGVNSTLVSDWYNKSTEIIIYNIYYFNSTARESINSNISKIILRNPIIISVSVTYQYFINIRLPNGTISNWFNKGMLIKLPSIIYNGSLERYVLNQSNTITINSTFNLTINYIKQYYVTIKLPNQTINNWFNVNSVITLPSIIYNGSLERYVLNQSRIINVNSPFNLTPSYIKQFYINVLLPNGTISGWYNYGSSIFLPKMIYINNVTRYIINQTNGVVVNNAFNLTPSYIKQYYVFIKLPNGTISNWFNYKTVIALPEVIYISNQERYVLNQSSSITVLYPMINETADYYKQYLVTINGINNWYNFGSTIKLYESVPIYETLTWVGNYTLPNNSNVTVNGPLIENAKISTNITFVGGIAAIIIVVAIAGIFLRKH
ncbi:MAG: thermopsin family protease [Caldisphaera sp.]